MSSFLLNLSPLRLYVLYFSLFFSVMFALLPLLAFVLCAVAIAGFP
jgi:hypothetical protein